MNPRLVVVYSRIAEGRVGVWREARLGNYSVVSFVVKVHRTDIHVKNHSKEFPEKWEKPILFFAFMDLEKVCMVFKVYVVQGHFMEAVKCFFKNKISCVRVDRVERELLSL